MLDCTDNIIPLKENPARSNDSYILWECHFADKCGCFEEQVEKNNADVIHKELRTLKAKIWITFFISHKQEQSDGTFVMDRDGIGF